MKALAKSLIGSKKKKGAAPVKAAAANNKVAAAKTNSKNQVAARTTGKKAATQTPQKAPMKATSNGNKRVGSAAPAKTASAAKAATATVGKAAAAAPAKAPAAKAPAAKASTGKAAKGARAGGIFGSRGHADAEAVCREVACEGLSTTVGYCRLHYIKNWKKIKRKELILKEGKLNQYIEELVAKYPDKYIEAIRQDLENDKDFAKVIYDLDLDESADDFDADGESADALIDTIKRDFDDEGEGGF